MTKTQWQTHIHAYSQSNLSKRAYTQEHDLVYSQFLYHMKLANDFVKPQVQIMPAGLGKSDNLTCLGIVKFTNGVRLLINSPELLTQLPNRLTRQLPRKGAVSRVH